jgi:iron complex outermembrane receptor protein
MSFVRHIPFFCAAGIACAQPLPPASNPSPAGVERLDKVVVSAGPDPKAASDLAQGTSVLVGDELRRAVQATLGDTLAATPGVSSTYYGPGASRPVIRGLGGDRIRVLDDGVGALDASNVSPDHNTALEPLFASRIEVLRGPSTLLYGSSAVGGAVNVIDSTIPDAPSPRGLSGTIELRGGGAAEERSALLSAGGGGASAAFHLNALKQKSGDVRIPGFARIDPAAPPGQRQGVLPGSTAETWSVAAGGSGFWPTGHAGGAISCYETDYGVPTGDDPPTSIRMRQTRFDFAGEVTQAFGPFRSARARASYGDYTHSELSGGTAVNTTFANRAWETRLELPHVAVGALGGTVGVQASRSDFSATGEEVATPPSRTTTAAVFALEEAPVGGRTTLQFGMRAERRGIVLGEVDSDLPAVAGYAARTGERRAAVAASNSLGLVFYPAKEWSVAGSLAYTERLPTAQELFSNGPHGGTGAYEIGTSGLGRERSLGVEASVRRRAGFVIGSLSVFANRFSDYVFEQELPADTIPASHNDGDLTPFQFVARDALFRGGELELQFHLLDGPSRHLHLDVASDFVRATNTTDDAPLPRIPPMRHSVQLSYNDGQWSASLEVRHARRAKQLAPRETPTAGYTVLNTSVSRLFAVGRTSCEIFVRGRNLTDAEAREHSSFLKDFAPLPGRGVLGGVRVSF